MNPQLQRFTDGLYVIAGAHLTLEEAREQFGKEYSGEDYDYDNDCEKEIISIKHQWVRYEYIGEFNCPDDFDPEPGDALWMLKEQEKRLKGIVRKATVVNEP